jgi:hypothetical protein
MAVLGCWKDQDSTEEADRWDLSDAQDNPPVGNDLTCRCQDSKRAEAACRDGFSEGDQIE